MGEGVKIPENERPSFAIISKQLDACLSRDLQKIFVQDIQNDCSCDIERYDSEIDPKHYVAYISKNGIEFSIGKQQVCLPMLPTICEKDVLQLLKAAGDRSDGYGPIDCDPRWMIYNPNSDFDHVLKTYVAHMPIASFEHFKKDSIRTDIVPIDQVWFTPDAEFFGCLSCNIDKFGIFCMPNQIYKKLII